jgi:hypothetical protein
VESKTVIVVSRKWNSPVIEVKLSDKEISMFVDLSQFIESLGKEMGNPALLLTNAQLAEKLSAASDKVVAELKEASKYIV